MNDSSLDLIFTALSDATRRAILFRLDAGEATTGDLATPYSMTLAGVMKHLRVLEEAGLVTREKRGRTMWCRLNAASLKEAADWMSHYRIFWEAQLDTLAVHLEQQDNGGSSA